jgi:hypothetical protein
MTAAPLMPKATAVWLIDNTSLTFEQIASFCKLHLLEVKGIADGDVAHGIKGMDPIASGQLTREELDRAQNDPNHELKLSVSEVKLPEKRKSRRVTRYTPVSKRQDRPNAILWLHRHHPELQDAQIIRLVGTTKPTITAVKERTHWNSAALQPVDPVALGLCSQTGLDTEVAKAAKRIAKQRQKEGSSDVAETSQAAQTLTPIAVSLETAGNVEGATEEHTIENVFGEGASGKE